MRKVTIIIINKGLPTDFCQLTMLIGELACSAVHNTTLLTKFDIKYKMFLKQNFLENNVLSTELSSTNQRHNNVLLTEQTPTNQSRATASTQIFRIGRAIECVHDLHNTSPNRPHLACPTSPQFFRIGRAVLLCFVVCVCARSAQYQSESTNMVMHA